MRQTIIRVVGILSCVVLCAASLSAQSFTVTAFGEGAGTPVVVPFSAESQPTQISAGPYYSIANTCGFVGGAYTWSGLGTAPGVPTIVALPAYGTLLSVASGDGHFLALTDRALYAWGSNCYGQLGEGTMYDHATPVQVLLPSIAWPIAIAAGYGHSLALTTDGVYAWGRNITGALGDGTYNDSATPVKVQFPPTVTSVSAIAAGEMTSFAITNDGLYGWGYNYFGQIGDGTTINNRPTPVKIVFDARPKKTPVTVTAVATSGHHTLAITSDGLYAWGENLRGCLGTRKLASSAVPVRIDFPKVVTEIRAIGAGRVHSLAVTNDGLYAWGDNSAGQLGLGAFDANSFVLTPTKVPGEDTAIAATGGDRHTIVLH